MNNPKTMKNDPEWVGETLAVDLYINIARMKKRAPARGAPTG